MSDTATAERMISTWEARRRLKVRKDTWREPYELFPEAHDMRVPESWEHGRRIARVEVPEAQFRAFVEEHIDDESARARIYARVGLNPDVVVRGTGRVGPKQPTVPVKEAPAEAPVRRNGAMPRKPAKKAPAKRVPTKKAAKKVAAKVARTNVAHPPVSQTDKGELTPVRELDDIDESMSLLDD